MSLLAKLGKSVDEINASARKLFGPRKRWWDPAVPTDAAIQLMRDAVRQQDKPALELLAEQCGADAVIWAASVGEIEVLESLIKAGASAKWVKPKREDELKQPPLYAAAAAGQAKAVEVLLAAGAGPDDCRSHVSPLHAAAAAGSVQIVQMLLKAGADVQGLGRDAETAIHAAAKAGKAEIIPLLHAAGVNLDAFDGQTRTALMYAASGGHEKVVRELLRLGASHSVTPPKVKDPIEAMMAQMALTTPMILAATEGHAGVVKLLLEAGADPKATDAAKKTAAEYAIKGGHRAVVDLLGGEPKEVGAQRKLWEAAAAGDLERVRAALRDGAKIDAYAERGSAEKTAGRNALMLAVQAGKAEVVRELISAGANLDVRDGTEEGWTAVHYAVANSDAAMLELLVRAGAKLSVESRMLTSSHTALHLSAERGDVAMVGALLVLGADPLASAAGDLPLYVAAEHGQTEAAQVLANREPRPVRGALLRALRKWKIETARALIASMPTIDRSKDDRGSPIWYALIGYYCADPTPPAAELVELVGMLLAKGADATELGDFGMPPAVLATGVLEVLRLLIEAGADVNASDPGGETPLMRAAQHGEVDALRVLLDAGADLTQVDQRGRSCLDLAQEHLEVAEILRAAGAQSGSELEAGKAIAGAAEKKRRAAEKKEQRQRRADAAIRPDFSKKAKSKAFEKATKRLEELTGRPARKVEEVPGLVYCEIESARCEALHAERHGEFLKNECYLFQLDLYVIPQTGHSAIAILPTKKQLEVVAAMGISAPNIGKGVADVVEGLEAIEKITPFVIEKIAHDTIEGRFTKKITAPKKLAKAIYDVCPDVVEQGTETVDALADELKKNGRLFLWWD